MPGPTSGGQTTVTWHKIKHFTGTNAFANLAGFHQCCNFLLLSFCVLHSRKTLGTWSPDIYTFMFTYIHTCMHVYVSVYA